MWVPKHVRVELNEPPFGASRRALEGQHRLLADGLEVANALERLDWAQPHAQLHICSHCGSEGCSGGNYGAARRAGSYVLLTPVWAKMAEGSWDAEEYAPPQAIATHGTLVLTLEQAELADWRSPSRAVSSARLSGVELLRIAQHEAPWHALGSFPDALELHRDVLFASSRGDVDVAVQELSDLLARFSSADEVILRERAEEDLEVDFYLDHPEYATWPAYTETGGLLLTPSFVAYAVDGDGA